jgi:hypothetical protein
MLQPRKVSQNCPVYPLAQQTSVAATCSITPSTVTLVVPWKLWRTQVLPGKWTSHLPRPNAAQGSGGVSNPRNPLEIADWVSGLGQTTSCQTPSISKNAFACNRWVQSVPVVQGSVHSHAFDPGESEHRAFGSIVLHVKSTPHNNGLLQSSVTPQIPGPYSAFPTSFVEISCEAVYFG